MSGPRSSLRAMAVAGLTLAALLGITHTAQAAPVVTQSARITIEGSTDAAHPGDPVTFTFTIVNTSSTAIAGEATLSFGNPILTPVGSSNCTVVTGPTPGSCDVGDIAVNSPRVEYGQFDPATDIPANSTAKVTISTTVAANATPGTYTATPEGYTTAAGDETFSPTSIGFTVLGPDADLAVGLNATPAPLLSNAILYIQTATNNGPATVSSGTVTTTLPAQTTGVTGLPANCAYNNTAKTVACTDTGLTASATATHTFTAHLNLLSLGALPASATRTTSSPADPNPANDTAGANCTALTGLIITC